MKGKSGSGAFAVITGYIQKLSDKTFVQFTDMVIYLGAVSSSQLKMVKGATENKIFVKIS